MLVGFARWGKGKTGQNSMFFCCIWKLFVSSGSFKASINQEDPHLTELGVYGLAGAQSAILGISWISLTHVESLMPLRKLFWHWFEHCTVPNTTCYSMYQWHGKVYCMWLWNAFLFSYSPVEIEGFLSKSKELRVLWSPPCRGAVDVKRVVSFRPILLVMDLNLDKFCLDVMYMIYARNLYIYIYISL